MSFTTACDVFFLGAGKPSLGNRPAALKDIGIHTRALDWQLHSLVPLPQPKIHFLGGYHIEEIITSYPQLHYIVVPQWHQHSIVHTLLKAPWRANTTFILYADTIFRPNVLQKVYEQSADIVLVYDANWRHRYENREVNDIAHAEIVAISQGELLIKPITTTDNNAMEFTGLLKFSPEVSVFIGTLSEQHIGRNLIDLLYCLTAAGFNVKAIDVQGAWTEFNSPSDIAHFVLGTKAETLSRLAPLVKKSIIGQQYCCTARAWQQTPEKIVQDIMQQFPATRIVIRSSAKSEDNWLHSNAGNYASVLNVDSTSAEDISAAIAQVFHSYKTTTNCEDQVLVQEFLTQVQCAGVVFTRVLETGAPYYRINFDDKSLSTESVTAGNSNNLRTVLLSRVTPISLKRVAPKLMPILLAVRELEDLLDYDRLDIEFAIDKQHFVHIFQVRPITVDHSEFEIEDDQIYSALHYSTNHFKHLQISSPFILGERAIFGVMSDWNPAEIIGTRPRPLAFSLYRFLITDEIWAKQRAEFGYRDVRPQPLLIAFCGQPYVDIRASLNSFIPAAVPDQTAEKLVEAYLAILTAQPHLHDKLEFSVAFTIWTPTFIEEACARLMSFGITHEQIDELAQGLKILTRQALLRLDVDTASICLLDQRRHTIMNSKLPSLDKAILLLEDCQRFGTLAFAHAARAGFVAMSFLNSFVTAGILSLEEKQNFLNSIKTIAGEFEEDTYKVINAQLETSAYYTQYGHLRPGTYDITMNAYWENPECYLLRHKTSSRKRSPQRAPFTFSQKVAHFIKQMLTELSSELSVADFLQYLSAAIRAREWAKFKFTSNLSRALDYCVDHGQSIGLSRENVSYLQFDELKQLKSGILTPSTLNSLIKQRENMLQITHMIELPQLLLKENDFYCFERMTAQPNFITMKCITAPAITDCHKNHAYLQGKIILVPQADPGYDWLFAHEIAGLVTQYGGANSHMAIRAAEMALPAAIGVGDKLYEELCKAKYLHLDCALQQIRGLA